MLDTNICVFAIRKKSSVLLKRLLKEDPDDVCISAISFAELLCGIEKSEDADKNGFALSVFLSPISIVDFDVAAAQAYGEIRAKLEKRGTPIEPNDTLIAAHAYANNLILVTNNTREFKRVEGLEIEDWTIS